MDEEAVLLLVVNEKDADGFPKENKERIPVFVEEKSATRSEFYEALRSGINIKLVLELRQEDWELSSRMESGKKHYATQIEYDGDIYNIVRTYKSDKAKIELICS